MEFFKVSIKRKFPDEEKVLGNANGEFVPDGKAYFDRMSKGEIIKDAPVFDYFHLQSFGSQEEWEWRLQDVHGFMGEYPTGPGWYISDRFKKLLERFHVAMNHCFYPTKLLYDKNKIDYWIFQFAVKNKSFAIDSIINFKQSLFYDELANSPINVKNYSEFKIIREQIETQSNYSSDLITRKVSLVELIDFLPLYGVNDSGVIVSAAFKKSVEDAGLEGLEFMALDYEVEVDVRTASL